MNCRQCGYEIRDTANFCKNCGAPVEHAHEKAMEPQRHDSQGEDIKATQDTAHGLPPDPGSGFWQIHRTKILLAAAAILILCAAGAAFLFLNGSGKSDTKEQLPAVSKKTVSSVDLQDVYEMEENRLVLDPLTVSYEDGTSLQLTAYKVYIDTVLYEAAEDGAIDGENLYEGKHLVRLEWQEKGQTYQYEKTVAMEHKKDTWEKYVDLVGKTGKEIAAAYGAMGEPVFAGLGEEDWGYAYADVQSLSIQVCFPVSILDQLGHLEDYGQSDIQCVEMSGTMDTFFYNLESEMTLEYVANTLNLTLAELENGGCEGTLSDGKRIFIGEGQVMDGIYTPDVQVRVCVSEEEKLGFLEQLF